MRISIQEAAEALAEEASGSAESAAAALPVSFENALAGTILIAGTVAATPVIWMMVRRIFGGRNVFFARWGFSHLLLVILTWVFASIGIAVVFGGRLASEEPIGIALSLGLAVLGYAPPALLAAWFAHKLAPDGVRSLGFRTERLGKAIGAAVVAYIAIVPGMLGVMHLWPYLLDRLGETAVPQVFAEQFRVSAGYEIWIGVALAVLVIPLIEEVLFRGFLQPLLVQNFRDAGGVVLTAALFGAMHGQSAFLPIFCLALLLGVLQLRTQRLVAVWFVHALHNGSNVAILLATEELALEGALLRVVGFGLG